MNYCLCCIRHSLFFNLLLHSMLKMNGIPEIVFIFFFLLFFCIKCNQTEISLLKTAQGLAVCEWGTHFKLQGFFLLFLKWTYNISGSSGKYNLKVWNINISNYVFLPPKSTNIFISMQYFKMYSSLCKSLIKYHWLSLWTFLSDHK